jgi:hypothetical protein
MMWNPLLAQEYHTLSQQQTQQQQTGRQTQQQEQDGCVQVAAKRATAGPAASPVVKSSA